MKSYGSVEEIKIGVRMLSKDERSQVNGGVTFAFELAELEKGSLVGYGYGENHLFFG